MISVEALVAQVGILPGKDEILTLADAKAARGIDQQWRVEARAWLDQSKPKRFTLCQQFPFERTLNALSGPLPPELFSQLKDPTVADACRELLDRARAYALSKWPARYLDRPERPGGLLMQPGQIELMGACAILAVLDDPDRMMDELRMESLEDAQVTAFKSVYPDLYKMLVAILWEEIDRKAQGDKEWFMTWPTELVFRRLIGLPPAMSITKADRPEPAAAHPTIKVDYSKLQSHAQKLNER